MHRGLWLRRAGSVLLVFFALSGTIRGERPAPLAPLQFLVGEWEGIGDQAGATGGRHDDLMVVYMEAGVVKADYFDNEGHVIRYVVDGRPGEAVFVSEIKVAEPRYRLTYTQASPSTLTGRFDVAPPGTPEAFGPYLSWTARKLK